MFQNKKVLGLIPARGGSKGIPKKNIVPLNGKPLIAWTIEATQQSKFLDQVVLSSECEEIIAVAKKYNCSVPFVRPSDLALDTTPGFLPALHAVRELPHYDYLVLLQPTSPLRSGQDIDEAIQLCIERKVSSVVSVSAMKQKPYWSYTVDGAGSLHALFPDQEKYSRRQDCPEVYALNGAIYVVSIPEFLKTEGFVMNDTLAYIMPEKRSIDIDTVEDLKLCEFILSCGAREA